MSSSQPRSRIWFWIADKWVRLRVIAKILGRSEYVCYFNKRKYDASDKDVESHFTNMISAGPDFLSVVSADIEETKENAKNYSALEEANKLIN